MFKDEELFSSASLVVLKPKNTLKLQNFTAAATTPADLILIEIPPTLSSRGKTDGFKVVASLPCNVASKQVKEKVCKSTTRSVKPSPTKC